jgi:hypothetical protein
MLCVCVCVCGGKDLINSSEIEGKPLGDERLEPSYVFSVIEKYNNIEENIDSYIHIHAHTAWLTSEWSTCSARCGEGAKTRSVECVSANGSRVDKAQCNAIRALIGQEPQATWECNGPTCKTYRYVYVCAYVCMYVCMYVMLFDPS